MPRARSQSAEILPEPRIDSVCPVAALPLGEVELLGAHLGPDTYGPPAVLIDGESAQVLMSRPTRLALRIPENGLSCSERPPKCVSKQDIGPVTKEPETTRSSNTDVA